MGRGRSWRGWSLGLSSCEDESCRFAASSLLFPFPFLSARSVHTYLITIYPMSTKHTSIAQSRITSNDTRLFSSFSRDGLTVAGVILEIQARLVFAGLSTTKSTVLVLTYCCCDFVCSETGAGQIIPSSVHFALHRLFCVAQHAFSKNASPFQYAQIVKGKQQERKKKECLPKSRGPKRPDWKPRACLSFRWISVEAR